ncbi:MAG TPA: hypothetical protein VMO47_02425 [Rhodothermales bacterium]|nr:hypothetical protein [Rhodothermales bacterium]
MRFVEMTGFTRVMQKFLTPDEYRELQNALHNGETRVDTIPGTGGLKKARWGAAGRGKRGGVRVIFYECVDRNVYLMQTIHPKSKRDDLTSEQKKS